MSIVNNREDGGRLVREAWVAWAKTQANPKPDWLDPWERLSEQGREADRCIWDAITAPYHRGIKYLQQREDILGGRIDRMDELLDSLEKERDTLRRLVYRASALLGNIPATTNGIVSQSVWKLWVMACEALKKEVRTALKEKEKPFEVVE